MTDLFKWFIGAGAAVAIVAMLSTTCASTPRSNCFTCVERCQPFRVAACEPAGSHVSPLYCACDPFTRVDGEPPASPAKGK